MDRREEEISTELCVLCGEEVDLLDPAAHTRVRGRAVCRPCAHRLGGHYNPETESWSREPRIPESLQPRQD